MGYLPIKKGFVYTVQLRKRANDFYASKAGILLFFKLADFAGKINKVVKPASFL